MAEKICKVCGTSKPLLEYKLLLKEPDGRNTTCNVCADQQIEAAKADKAQRISAEQVSAYYAAMAEIALQAPTIKDTTMSQEIHSSSLPPIEQKPSILDPKNYDGDIIIGERVINKDYADELAFNEEPVTIRIEPSSDANASIVVEAWCNGKGAEIFMNGRWYEITYLPVGRVITTKRKYLEVIVRAKVDKISTRMVDRTNENPENRIDRRTISAYSFSVIQDNNPRGGAWLTELHRRNI